MRSTGFLMVLLMFAAVLLVPTAEIRAADFDYDGYAEVLSGFVDKDGMVNYSALKENRDKLDMFVKSLGKLDRKTYESWNEKDKIAFCLNSYNVLTLKAIVDNYPIKASMFGSIKYPKNSIRQIKGVWDKLTFQVIGRGMTLDEIEHQSLRKEFDEPRIHVALVCAAMSCPSLRTESYVGLRLDQQLDDQARKFLSNPQKFRIERKKNRVYISSIFKWFGEDFIKIYEADEGFGKHSPQQRAVLNFISRYLNKDDSEYLRDGKYSIKYIGYDWSLNEQ